MRVRPASLWMCLVAVGLLERDAQATFRRQTIGFIPQGYASAVWRGNNTGLQSLAP
jgi:hypothetical protein